MDKLEIDEIDKKSAVAKAMHQDVRYSFIHSYRKKNTNKRTFVFYK